MNSEKENNNILNLKTVNTDLILKSIFWGAIFYLLSIPEVHKCVFKVTGNNLLKYISKPLLMSIIYTVIYFTLSQLI